MDSGQTSTEAKSTPYMRDPISRAKDRSDRFRSAITGERWNGRALVLVVLGLQTTVFSVVPEITNYEDREGRHALLLFWGQGFIEWLPRIGEVLKVG